MLNELCTSLAELKKKLDLEAAERAKVVSSEEYAAIGKEIDALMQKQNALLAPLPDSRLQYEELRKQVIDAMNREGVWAVGQVAAKFREKSEVNTSKVLQVIGGDMDIYISLSNITQVRLKDFAKTSPELKKPLLDCIETVSREIVDLEVSAFDPPRQ